MKADTLLSVSDMPGLGKVISMMLQRDTFKCQVIIYPSIIVDDVWHSCGVIDPERAKESPGFEMRDALSQIRRDLDVECGSDILELVGSIKSENIFFWFLAIWSLSGITSNKA